MPSVHCLTCGAEIDAGPRGIRKYCDEKCRGRSPDRLNQRLRSRFGPMPGYQSMECATCGRPYLYPAYGGWKNCHDCTARRITPGRSAPRS
jgi:hypothetical protein